MKFVIAAGTTHERFDRSAVTPSELSQIKEMHPGATATRNVATMVPSADVEKGTWAVSELFGDDFFFAAQ